VTPLSFTFVTSTVALSGTYDDIYISLVGSLSTTGPMLLQQGFDAGSSVKIVITPPSEIGQLLSFNITGSSDGWLLDSVLVQSKLYPDLAITLNKWIRSPGFSPLAVAGNNLKKIIIIISC
jgi:hypothetical protein